MPDSSRLFFALWPDEQTRLALARLSKTIEAKGCKWMQPRNLHVTLVFLGQVDKEVAAALKQSAADIVIPPFELNFDRLSYWSKPKILCLTCGEPQPEAAAMLADVLTIAAKNHGLQTDTRPYTPHITLARHACYLPDIRIEPVIWRAEAFCLVESCSEPGGTAYKVLQQWPLI